VVPLCARGAGAWQHHTVTLLLTLLILVVVGLVAAVAAGRIAGGLDEPSSSLPGRGLPEGRVGMGDIERVRFSPALRGYRMDEVDDVLDRLTEELQLRDEEIAELRRTQAVGLPATPARAPLRTHETAGWLPVRPELDDQPDDGPDDDEAALLRRTTPGRGDDRHSGGDTAFLRPTATGRGDDGHGGR
jgi:DivIVA domain-containing protein